ncbi:hypothetical protein [Haloquadratum walsbyi]|jgi:hypothetical protein|uniref:Uncharacterized protein n=1 Tax=Haloquadratum walsbyi J07HQW2 TaxID=1238425 RepID=U1PVJ6_9EURY|nr:hypothetical protein [Haloquadratum walsbyi]ERG96426.1 MAG: hypothetical protein J07HQW2_02905 [Haloquadratum walsbyi J07HQW2]
MPTAPSEEQSSDHTFTKDSFDVGDEYKMDDRRNWDRDIGAKWLGRVGSVAFVLGIVFFSVATEAGILDPPGRIAAGTTGRTTLLAGGQRIARRQGHKR